MPNILRYSIRAFAFLIWVVTPTAFAEPLEVESGSTISPLVELYTSEGCSSCPPADAWISRLGAALDDQFQAVPLAFHVDYWNYLGWEDPFSHPDHTQRQRMLGALNRQHSIYTPEFLVSGRETRGTNAVVEAIRFHNRKPATVTIGLLLERTKDDEVSMEVTVRGDTGNTALYLAVYENDIDREIGAGENRGRTLHYDYVVRDFREVALLGSQDYRMAHRIPVEGDWNPANLGLAVMVLDRDTLGTRQALGVPLKDLFAEG